MVEGFGTHSGIETMTTGTILVTGATGFVGGAVLHQLRSSGGCNVLASVREPGVAGQRHIDLSSATDWSPTLEGIDCVIHTAGIAHRRAGDAETLQVNHVAAFRLATTAARAGVRRFVFVSSIAVHGTASRTEPIQSSSAYAPNSTYGIAKMRAEMDLLEFAEKSEMEVVIVRPPLVYGAGAGGNFRALLRWIQRGWPLPLGGIGNCRSLVSIANLTSLLQHCIDRPAATGRVLLVSDDDDVSTTQLVTRLITLSGSSSRLTPCPQRLLAYVAAPFGRARAIDGLLGDLRIDVSATRQALNWSPPQTLDQGLRCAVGLD